MAVPLKMNKYIMDYTLLDYAGHIPDASTIELDCSLGVNHMPMANRVFSKLHGFRQETGDDPGNYKEIKDYPHDGSLTDTIAQWHLKKGVGNGWLTSENIVLGNGSMNVLCNLNLLCLTYQKKAMGHAPQFTAYIDDVYSVGATYDAYYMQMSDKYKFNTSAYISKMASDFDLFIVENPNNPTGQVIPLAEIRQIAEKALSLGTILIVDEAYGEYMPPETSAINLIPSFPNIVVTRTFSKGFGMAGMRLGYGVSEAPIKDGNLDANYYNVMTQLQKLQIPFHSNSIARVLAKAALEATMNGDDPDGNPYDPFDINNITNNKRSLIGLIKNVNEAFKRNVQIAETHASTPILTLYYEDAGADFDFQAYLVKHGLLTVSCATYLGLDKRAVRLMLPRDRYSDLFTLHRIMTWAIENIPVSKN